MEEIVDLSGVRAGFLQRVAKARGHVGGHCLDRAPLLQRQFRKEAGQRSLGASFAYPDDAARLQVEHRGQVGVP